MRQLHSAISIFATMAVAIAVLMPVAAFAGGGALLNGATHTGVIPVGGLDTWTFTAAKDDSITVSIGEVTGSGQDPYFYPWIRLQGPDGSDLGSEGGTAGDWGTNAAQLDIRAPTAGTYTLLAADYPYSTQYGAGNYILTMSKTPGPYTISPGDEGGPMTNAVAHAGTITEGDLDTWTFQATRNDNITISIGEVPASGQDPYFYPWIRLRGPDGADLGTEGGTTGDWGTNAAQISVRVPLTGIYTLLVADYPYSQQQAPGSYIVTGSGLRTTGFSLAGILAVVGSTQGSGAFFRTSIQIHNPGTTSISGKFVYHRQGFPGQASDPSLAYTLGAGETVNYPDILPAMGVSGGLGSLDIMSTGDPIPIIAARIFSDGGANGTAGFFLEPLAPGAALHAGDSGVIIAPSDPQQARLNLGVRSLGSGASFLVTVRNRHGIVRGTTTKAYSPNFFEQVGASSYAGMSLESNDTITFSVTSGEAIVYGAQTDNKTQDPSAQYARKLQ